MIESRLGPRGHKVIDLMVDLAHCSKLDRIILAGANSAALMFELHKRGYVRVTTTANCGLPARQYEAALVDWGGRSLKALDATLAWLVDFLRPAGVLVAWLDPQATAENRKFRAILERHGMTAQAGAVHERGSAVAAQRLDMKAISEVT
jgi:hypothetical protein